MLTVNQKDIVDGALFSRAAAASSLLQLATFLIAPPLAAAWKWYYYSEAIQRTVKPSSLSWDKRHGFCSLLWGSMQRAVVQLAYTCRLDARRLHCGKNKYSTYPMFEDFYLRDTDNRSTVHQWLCHSIESKSSMLVMQFPYGSSHSRMPLPDRETASKLDPFAAL
jgi:hypothetical protein